MGININEEQAYEVRRAIEGEIRRISEAMTAPDVEKMPALKGRASHSVAVLSEVLTMLVDNVTSQN